MQVELVGGPEIGLKPFLEVSVDAALDTTTQFWGRMGLLAVECKLI